MIFIPSDFILYFSQKKPRFPELNVPSLKISVLGNSYTITGLCILTEYIRLFSLNFERFCKLTLCVYFIRIKYRRAVRRKDNLEEPDKEKPVSPEKKSQKCVHTMAFFVPCDDIPIP